MMEQGRARLSGVLGGCYDKVRDNFYNKISAQVHANTYGGEHPLGYAEPEFTGKYLDLCATYYERDRDRRALEKGMLVVESIERNMRADGYLGCLPDGYERHAFSVWNHGFTLYGLCRMYQATGDADILRLAIRAADWVEALFRDPAQPEILDAGNHGSQHISCLFAMGKIYALTGDKRYAEFMRRVVEHCEQTTMNLLSFDDILKLMSTKGIEMLVIYLGVLQYGQLMGDHRAIEAAQRYWQQINDTQIRNTGNGTVREEWTQNGNAARLMPTEERPNETCVAAGWMELSLALFYQQPRACYLDAIEQSLYNHMLGSLDPRGEDLAYYQGNFGKKNFRTDEGWYQCCRYRGFTMFSYLPAYQFYDDGETLMPMLYAPGSYAAKGISVRQITDYPSVGDIHFDISCDDKARKLRLRIPAWCDQWTLSVNGQAVSAQNQQGFVSLSLAQGETAIDLKLHLPLRRLPHEIDGKRYVSFQYGPLLLASDTRFGSDLWTAVASDAPIERAQPLTDTLAHFTCDGLNLIDFASAGSRHPGEDEYTVFIPCK